MLVLKRNKNSKESNIIRGYNGIFCFYDDLSKWEKAKLEHNNFFSKLYFYLFHKPIK